MRRAALLILIVAPLLASCSYWNTFYLARKNYDKATLGQPYIVETNDGKASQDFQNSIKYSKKLLGQYPKSKWVPAAYLLWARALIGRLDPIEAANMLSSFSTRFPQSPLKPDATFYLGVAYRQAHKPAESLAAFDEFLAGNKKHEMVPYALLERARALAALDRKGEAAEAAGMLVNQYPKSPLVRTARVTRADALFDEGDFAQAREDYRALGLEAISDEERFGFLLREADCVQGAHDYDGVIQLLNGALSHELEPQVVTSTTATGTQVTSAPTTPGSDRWGRLKLRIGAAQVLAGRLDPALQEYADVLRTYPHTALAAEAQFRTGYAYEMVSENFDKAREEYAKVKDIATLGGFAQQALDRMTNLERLAQFGKSAGRDSVARKAEAGFLLAELYLFQHQRPDRALEQYHKIEQDYPGTPWAGKAINAQGWLLSRKMNKKSEADSLFWVVVRDYRATEAQLAARDYLEHDGISVPDSLIEAPKELLPVLKAETDSLKLTPPPLTTPKLGQPGGMPGDSLSRFGLRGRPPMFPGRMPGGADSLRFGMPPAPMRPGIPDSLARGPLTAPDSLARGVTPSPGDTTARKP